MLHPQALVRVWSPCSVSAEVARQVPVQIVDLAKGKFPKGGNLLIVGGFFPVGEWISRGNFERVILLHNSPFHRKFKRTLRSVARQAPGRVELEFASEWLMNRFGAKEGRRQISLVDLSDFKPRESKEGKAFVVGRHSRDSIEKHHRSSLRTYRKLSEAGIEVKVLGGSVLSNRIGPLPRLELLPENTEKPSEFLRGLDCFYYRTSYSFPEAHSRAVTEALLTALPVVAHRRGGYVDFIEHGKSGFLYRTETEAMEYIHALKEDPELADEVGRAGRDNILRVLGSEARGELCAHLLRGSSPEPPPVGR
ncbi:MAG TPA: glycosyltransferase [Fimbriimonadaceae bacterium]|nr:glycosyltransferase [Fimbriimonadaceae bacterium]